MTQSVQAVAKPAPLPDDLSRPFFEGAVRGELMIQHCARCNTYLAPGSRFCTECWNEALAWVQASGRATLFTYGIMHQQYHPGFAGQLPYNIAVVQLDEGPRLNTNIVGMPNDQLRVGMQLEVTFEPVSDSVWLPKFRPRR